MSKMLELTALKGESVGIDDPGIIVSQISELCLSDDLADVRFEIQDEDEKIPGHRVILATRSKYFRAMLFGGLVESKQEIIKVQAPMDAFKAILTYIYTGQLLQSQLCEENIQGIFVLAHQYGLTQLELIILQHFYQILSLDNVIAIRDTAKLYNLGTLQSACDKYLDSNANEILVHESFNTLSEEVLKDIIGRDTFCAPEFQIFTAVNEWCKHNQQNATKSVVSLVRLPLISFEQLFDIVQTSGIFDDRTIQEAIKQKRTSTSLPYRNGLWQDENVATQKFGARVIQGQFSSDLFDGDTTKGYARHRITKGKRSHIIVELGSLTMINHIKLRLLDTDQQIYSYFIDVSENKTQWERVVDYQSYECHSWQFLYFPSRAVRYIKLVGTYGSRGPVFEVVSLESYFITKVPKMMNGVVVPTENVATVAMGAFVTGDYVGTTQYLLNGDINNYNSESGYTSHEIPGSIIVHLGQPYMIGSMRFLLSDCDDDEYSFYIETSINWKDWQMLVDKRKQLRRSWQNITFKPRTMVQIKIVGTYGDPYFQFNCVHFECPSQILNTSGKQTKAVRKNNRAKIHKIT